MTDWWLLNDIRWSGFEKKLMGNFGNIARDPNQLKINDENCNIIIY
jgi:hypothetical protein